MRGFWFVAALACMAVDASAETGPPPPGCAIPPPFPGRPPPLPCRLAAPRPLGAACFCRAPDGTLIRGRVVRPPPRPPVRRPGGPPGSE